MFCLAAVSTPSTVLAAVILYGIWNVYPGKSAAFLAAAYKVSRRTVGRALETAAAAPQNDTGASQNDKNTHGIKGRLKTVKPGGATPPTCAHKARGFSLRNRDGTAAAGGGPGPWIYNRRALADLNERIQSSALDDRRAVGHDTGLLDTRGALQEIPPPWATGPGIRAAPGRLRRGRRDPDAPLVERVPGAAETIRRLAGPQPGEMIFDHAAGHYRRKEAADVHE